MSSQVATADAAVVTEQQGLHQWPVLGGKLIAVAGTYQDVLTYKRSLTFYFTNKNGEEWNHVPIIESKVDRTFTWFSISKGETTVADAKIIARQDGVYLAIATVAKDQNGIVISSYKFTENANELPDGPAYVFKKFGDRVCPKKLCATVEDALKTETSTKLTK
ncbi:hypothetical protein GCM10027277_11030 [Pseudoduganella ginsengisoli]